LRAHWRFQNGVKDVPAASGHVVLDSSGNDQNGLAIGAPVFRRVGLPVGNLALQFAADEQRVFVPDDRAFEMRGSLTLEAWVRVDRHGGSGTSLGYIVFRGDDRAGLDPWFLGVADTGPRGDGIGIGIGNLQSGSNQAFRGLIAQVRVCAAALVPERFLRAALR
jgi:hypothetical protein